jgi:hypothetical protein
MTTIEREDTNEDFGNEVLDEIYKLETLEEKTTMFSAVLEGLRRPSHSRPLVAKPMTMRAIHDTKPLLKKAPTDGGRN